jgi:hypothetical protein
VSDFVNERVIQEWSRRAGRVGPEVRSMVERTGKRMLAISRRHMDEQIYSIPEDETKAGKKKWVRTGRLRKAEDLVYAPDGSGVTLTNTMPYARARHELGRNGRHTKRPAHWREGIVNELRESTARELAIMNRRILEGR